MELLEDFISTNKKHVEKSFEFLPKLSVSIQNREEILIGRHFDHCQQNY